MLAIPPQAHTTPAVRAAIARWHDSSSVLAGRYGVSELVNAPASRSRSRARQSNLQPAQSRSHRARPSRRRRRQEGFTSRHRACRHSSNSKVSMSANWRRRRRIRPPWRS